MRRGHEDSGLGWVDAHHQAALTTRCDRHVAADEEGQAAEHPLLGDVGVAADQLADSMRKVLVVRHGSIIAYSHVSEAIPVLGNCIACCGGSYAKARASRWT
jgi:hypothetical protein